MNKNIEIKNNQNMKLTITKTTTTIIKTIFNIKNNKVVVLQNLNKNQNLKNNFNNNNNNKIFLSKK